MPKDIKKVKSAATSTQASVITPLGDRVLIKEDTHTSENKTASGIIIPVTIEEDKGSKKGKIIAVGTGHYEHGNLIPVSVKVGDIVLFQWGEKISIEGAELYIVKETELLAVLTK